MRSCRGSETTMRAVLMSNAGATKRTAGIGAVADGRLSRVVRGMNGTARPATWALWPSFECLDARFVPIELRFDSRDSRLKFSNVRLNRSEFNLNRREFRFEARDRCFDAPGSDCVEQVLCFGMIRSDRI
jgi:hypothetical protein